MKHMFLRQWHMRSDRRLDDDGLVLAERIPDAVEEQIRIVAEGRPMEHDFIVAARHSADELRKLDFQEFNDVRRNRPHRWFLNRGERRDMSPRLAICRRSTIPCLTRLLSDSHPLDHGGGNFVGENHVYTLAVSPVDELVEELRIVFEAIEWRNNLVAVVMPDFPREVREQTSGLGGHVFRKLDHRLTVAGNLRTCKLSGDSLRIRGY